MLLGFLFCAPVCWLPQVIKELLFNRRCGCGASNGHAAAGAAAAAAAGGGEAAPMES